MSRSPKSRRWTVSDFVSVMDHVAPTSLAQQWDNVGLLAGDPSARLGRVLLCIDLMPNVVKEAVSTKADLVLAYHPPIFKPVHRLRSDSSGMESSVFHCIRHGIAIYSTHTALDAAEGGTNDVLATLCGIKSTEPLEYVDQPMTDECKMVVFVPESDVAKVADAMFAAGAGHIGDYSHCGYQSPGKGSFLGGDDTNPTIGRKGRLEYIEEQRLETVVKTTDLPRVVTAMINAVPYEEPAFDIYPLKPAPVRGIGRLGELPRVTTLAALGRKLKRAVHTPYVELVGDEDQAIDRAVIVAGAGGSLPFRAALCETDIIITGEIRHHDALSIRRNGCCAIALGHWASERPVLQSLSERLAKQCPGLDVRISTSDCDPFRSA